MPRPRYILTPEDQRRVRELAVIGLPDDDIASLLQLSVSKLRKLFKHELEQGGAAGREEAIRTLHSIAVAGQNISALLFLLKARCGWRDTGPLPSPNEVVPCTLVIKTAPGPYPGDRKPLAPSPSASDTRAACDARK
jgi:hypothetical protein